MKNTRQYFLGYVNNIPDRFCSSTKTILNRVLVTHNNSNFGAIFLINNLFSTFLKHALQTNRMTPILTWIMYLRIAPVVRKLSPTVDISAYGAVSAYFSWLVAREEYSLLLVGKGYGDGGTLYGSRSPVRAHPILVGLCPVKLIKLEISSNNAHSLWQGLRISLLTPILIPVFIYNCELKTLSKSFF